jgi:hypothetical protein
MEKPGPLLAAAARWRVVWSVAVAVDRQMCALAASVLLQQCPHVLYIIIYLQRYVCVSCFVVCVSDLLPASRMAG